MEELMDQEKVKRVARVLFKKFPHITRMESIHVACLILEALELPPLKQIGEKPSE
jgi:hypothetical protein